MLDLVIGGAPKAGTTTLARVLDTHPQIAFAAEKEPRFFTATTGLLDGGAPDGPLRSGRHDRGQAWFDELFRSAPSDARRAEASTVYLAAPDACDLLHAACPRAMIVFLLRDPVDRVYSHYWQERRSVDLPDFGDMLRTVQDGEVHPRLAFYLRSSRYADSLSRWWSRWPADQILVRTLEDLQQDAPAVLRAVTDRLDVAPIGAAPSTLPRHNASRTTRWPVLNRIMGRPAGALKYASPTIARAIRRAARRVRDLNAVERDYPPLPAGARAALLPHLRDDTERLQELLDRDLAGWLRP